MGSRMSEGGTLEPLQPVYGGFIKDPLYSSPSSSTTSTTTTSTPPNNINGLTELASADSSHLTLLKSTPLPFSSFDMEGLGSRLIPSSSSDTSTLSSTGSGLMEMRYVELQNWDLSGYPGEGLTARLIDNRNLLDSDSIIQYRPWEKPGSLHEFSNGNQKLPSFQSQFNSFQELSPHHHHHQHQSHHNQHHLGIPPLNGNGNGGGDGLPSFHTLPPPVNHRGGYPNAPVPIQARELPNIQQQYLDERHIQLFPGQLLTTNGSTVSNGHHFVMTTNTNGGHFGTNGGTILQDLVPVPPMVHHGMTTKTDGNIPGLNINPEHAHMNLHMQKYLSPTTPNSANSNNNNNNNNNNNSDGLETLVAVKIPPPHGSNGFELNLNGHNGHGGNSNSNHNNHHFNHAQQIIKLDQQQQQHQQQQNSPQIVSSNLTPTPNGTNGTGKRQIKRKRGDNNNFHHHDLNNGHHHHNNNNNHHHDQNGEPQVSSVSSTDSADFKRPNGGHIGGILTNGHHGHHPGGLDDSGLDKPTKKKRKRCGECIGCQRKDNCGDCAPCRNEKSHQICKVRRCERLTEKKVKKMRS